MVKQGLNKDLNFHSNQVRTGLFHHHFKFLRHFVVTRNGTRRTKRTKRWDFLSMCIWILQFCRFRNSYFCISKGLMWWVTSNCENEGADWEHNFPGFSLESVHRLQDGRHHTDSTADEEISQHIKLRHHNKHQHGSTKRHQTLNDKDLEKKHMTICWRQVKCQCHLGVSLVSLGLLRW